MTAETDLDKLEKRVGALGYGTSRLADGEALPEAAGRSLLRARARGRVRPSASRSWPCPWRSRSGRCASARWGAGRQAVVSRRQGPYDARNGRFAGRRGGRGAGGSGRQLLALRRRHADRAGAGRAAGDHGRVARRDAVLDRDADDDRRRGRGGARRDAGGGRRGLPVPRRRTARRRGGRTGPVEHLGTERPRSQDGAARQWRRVDIRSCRRQPGEGRDRPRAAGRPDSRRRDRARRRELGRPGPGNGREHARLQEGRRHRLCRDDQRRSGAAHQRHRRGEGQHHRPRRAPRRGGTGIEGSHRALHRPLLALLHAGRGCRRRAGGGRAAARFRRARGANGYTRGSPYC